MPRLINHADRHAAFREIAATLAAEDGVQALTLQRLADYGLVSPDTVRRSIGHPRHLPLLALRHLDHASRQRELARHWARPRESPETSWRHAVALVRDEAPLTEATEMEAKAWLALAPLARANPEASVIVARHVTGIRARVTHLVGLSSVPPEERADATLSLCAMLRGVALGLAEDWMTGEDVERLLTARLTDLAPLAPDVNDR